MSTKNWMGPTDLLPKLAANAQRKLAVFDLDSTLFDVSPRTQQILDQFIQLNGANLDQELLTLLRQVQIAPKDWGIREALQRYQVQEKATDWAGALRKYWVEHFFSGQTLEWDRPYPGAVQFLQQLTNPVVYLSARNEQKMRAGTLNQLQQHGFPLFPVVLKEHSAIADDQFKKNWFAQLEWQKWDEVYFFENEPHTLHEVCNAFSRVKPVFIDSTHSRRSEPNPEWIWLRSWS